jgi:hypothetical protein
VKPKEFYEAMSELIDATNVLVEQVFHEPTLEARNVMFYRDRFFDCLEEWHQATITRFIRRQAAEQAAREASNGHYDKDDDGFYDMEV